MRIDLLKNGLVDDLVVEARAVRVARSGEARYRIEVHGEEDLEIEVWTTRKSRLSVKEREPPPDWVQAVAESQGDVEHVDATDCLVHLEQMHRRSYFLGLSGQLDSWGLSFSSPAYAKARITSTKRPAG